MVPLCGGNIDITVLGRVIERGLAADGRLIRLTVPVSDRPRGIADFTRLVADLGASVKDIFHERAWLQYSVDQVELKVVLETRGVDHNQQILTEITRAGYTGAVINALGHSATYGTKASMAAGSEEHGEDCYPLGDDS